MAKLFYGLNQSLDGYVDHQVLRCFVTSSSRRAARPAVCTVAACMRSCVIRTKTAPSGTRRSVTSRRRGGANRNGSCLAR